MTDRHDRLKWQRRAGGLRRFGVVMFERRNATVGAIFHRIRNATITSVDVEWTETRRRVLRRVACERATRTVRHDAVSADDGTLGRTLVKHARRASTYDPITNAPATIWAAKPSTFGKTANHMRDALGALAVNDDGLRELSIALRRTAGMTGTAPVIVRVKRLTTRPRVNRGGSPSCRRSRRPG